VRLRWRRLTDDGRVLLGADRADWTPEGLAELGYLAPLARTPALDAAFRAIPAEQFAALEYVSARDRATAWDEPKNGVIEIRRVP
jgi:hypothetical protein